jgi:hypothetical protein
MRIHLLAAIAFVGAWVAAVAAQCQPHHEAVHPRVGIMSEEVVREKFKSYGVEVTSLEPRENRYVVHAHLEGRPITLELDRLSGTVTQEGKSLRMRPATKAIPLAIKPNARRVPWVKRTIRFDKIGVEGIRRPATPIHR